MNFFIKTVSGVLFLENFKPPDKLALAKSIVDSTDNLLDGEPMLLPIPDDAPAEFPRIVLRRRDERYACNVCGNRFEFVFDEKGDPSKDFEEVAKEHQNVFLKATKVLTGVEGISIPRAGYIVRLFTYLDESANAFIKKAFTKEGPVQSAYEIQVNTLDRLSLGDFKVNRWIKLSALRRKDTQEDNVLLTVLDLNTFPEENYEFSQEKLDAFFKTVVPFVGESLKQHFSL